MSRLIPFRALKHSPSTNATDNRLAALCTCAHDHSQVLDAMHTPASTSKPPLWLHTTLLHQENLRLRTAITQLSRRLMQMRRIHNLQGQVVHTQQELISALEWRRLVNGSTAGLSAYGELTGLQSSAHLGPSRTWLPPSPEALANPLVVLAETAEMYRFAGTQGGRGG